MGFRLRWVDECDQRQARRAVPRAGWRSPRRLHLVLNHLPTWWPRLLVWDSVASFGDHGDLRPSELAGPDRTQLMTAQFRAIVTKLIAPHQRS